MIKIWCLFGEVVTMYDQPPNDLVAWWPERPNIAAVGAAIGIDIPKASYSEIQSLVSVLSEKTTRIDDVEFKLEQLAPGVLKRGRL